jgi:hypothetical protein
MNETRRVLRPRALCAPPVPLAAAVLCALLLALAPAPSASAAPALGWSAPAQADGEGQPTSVSCPAQSLCVGVDGDGRVLSTGHPTAAIPAWTAASIDPGQRLSGVSCASASLCVAVDARGEAFASTDPTGGAGSWSAKAIDAGRELTGVSCPASTLCVAVDSAGDALVGSDPAKGVWGPASDIDGGTALSAVSCASASLCVAVDVVGAVLAAADPAAGASAWRRRPVGLAAGSTASSCGSGGVCIAVDASGDAAASADPTGATPTWASTALDPGRALTAASCAPLGQCVAVDDAGRALASEAPTLAPPSWSYAGVDGAALVAVSCASGNFCLALDAAGRSLSAPLPPPLSLVPPPMPRPSIAGTPALGSQLSCQPGVPALASGVQLGYQWLRDTEPIAGAAASGYAVSAADEGHHLQCRVTATDAAGSAAATSAFVTVPFQGLPVASAETTVGLARALGARVIVPVACSAKAPHGCRLLLRLTRGGTSRGAAARSTLASRRVRLGRGVRRGVAVELGAVGRRLLARRRRLAVTLLVSGTVVGSIEAPLAEQSLLLASRRLARARPARLPQPQATRGTPYMGWDSYFAFGPRYSESTVLEQANELISLGLARRGYRLVWLDVGWWQGQRGADGRIAIDRSQWPHGIAWLARALHRAGLRLGLYTDAGSDGCGGVGQGSFGHYRQDAQTFAAWGVDALKVDFCGGSLLGLGPAEAYRELRAALDASGRPMLLSVCDFLQPGEHADGTPSMAQSVFASYAYGPQVGASWRTDGDVGVPGRVPFGNVLRNLDADAAHPQAASPGHWNDPDYLGPDQGMGTQQFRTQVSMWAMLAAPLMVSRDLARLSRASLAALSNGEVIAIDQDPLGAQGTLMVSEGAAQVWIKTLSDGSRAVALLNRGPAGARIQTSVAAVGLPAARRYLVRDLWRHATSATTGPLVAQVGAYSTVLLRVSTAG